MLCCGQLGPYETALKVPLYGSLGSGRRKRLFPVLDWSQNMTQLERLSAYGGFANGIPKKLVTPLLVEPMKSFEVREASISTGRAERDSD